MTIACRIFVWILLVVASPAFAAVAEHGMVAAEHELAARAGAEMLARGGNAVDAAIAAGFATGIVNPSSCGIGGGGFLLVRDGKSGRERFLDFRETAPRAARSDMYVRNGKVDPALSLRGVLAVAVPGEVRGLLRGLADFGTLPLGKVMEPAIRYAAEGFPVGNHLAEELRRNAEEIRRRPPLAAVYLKPNGEPYAVGERLVQRDLAETLRRIAERGANAFYEGPIAETIVATLAAEGGMLSSADLSGYREQVREPLRVDYRGFTILGAPPPSSG
ncbi:MAG: gamma-glutamyltransferase, partial [Candidatus Binatia bacterium]